jgi:KDO2-lipid IV(A) lauroyltransferase
MGDGLGLLWYYIFPFRRQLVIENLENAFKNGFSNKALRGIARNNFRHYGKTLIEVLCTTSWKNEDYKKNIVYHGLENLASLRKNGRGFFLLTLHIGNWEAAIGATAALGIPLCIVVKGGASAIYRNLQQWYRSRQNVIVLNETRTAADILRLLNRGYCVGFVLDQFMGPPIGLPVTFFGNTAGTTASLALLTERNGAAVIPTHTYRDSRGRIHMVYEPALDNQIAKADLAEKLYEKTQLYNDVLERIVRSRPEQWMWLHRRWKPYRGFPRWLRPVMASIAVLFCIALGGCVEKHAVETKTGISLPEDRPIEVPKFTDASEPPETERTESQTSTTDKPTASELPITFENKATGLSEPGSSPTPQVAPIPILPVTKPSSPKKTKPLSKTTRSDKTPAAETIPAFRKIPPDKIPFDLGERMEVELSWMALPAGKAILEVRPGQVFGGRETFLLWGQVLSSRLVDTIYHVENTIESFVDREGFIPYKFLLHMFETNQKKETRVLFDHPRKKAFYWAKRLSQKWGDMNEDRTDELVPEAQDMFSALYYSRMLDYRMSKLVQIPVYENGKNWDIELLPVANEIVTSALGAFQCWKIRVRIKLNNVLSQTGEMFLWLSDDSKRYLVKFDAKIKIGSLVGNLMKLREKT